MDIVVRVTSRDHKQNTLDVTRSDVFELVLAIVPLLRQQRKLSEKVWIETLGCCGVCELKGVRQSNSASEIKGRLTTHPPLEDASATSHTALKRLKFSTAGREPVATQTLDWYYNHLTKPSNQANW